MDPGEVDRRRGGAEDPGEVFVGEPVLFRLDEEVGGGKMLLVRQQSLLELHEFPHLVDEPVLDVGTLVEEIGFGPLAQRFVHEELAFARRLGEHSHEFRQGLSVKVFREAKPVATDFQGADQFLQRLLVRLPDAHDLAPTARICVPRRSCTPLNFSKAHRANFTTTYSPDGVYFSRVPSRQ